MAEPLVLARTSQVGIEFDDTSTGKRYLGVNGGNLYYGVNLNHGSNNRVLTTADEGTGNGLDADLLDGEEGSSYLRSNVDDVFTGNLTTGADNHITFGPNTTWGSSLRVGGNGRTATGTEMASVVTTDGNLHLDAFAASTNVTYINYYAGTGGVAFGGGASAVVAFMGPDGDLWKGPADNNGSKYWHAGNDGTGSGLDADTVDGIDSGSFLRSDQEDEANKINIGGEISASSDKTSSIWIPKNGPIMIADGNASTTTWNTTNELWIYNDGGTLKISADATATGNKILTTADEGTGNGLDADTLDGFSSYLEAVVYLTKSLTIKDRITKQLLISIPQ